jgi:antagonist of KipI
MPEVAHLHVLRPGLLTTVQDLGRFGFQRFGMPVSGAMDTTALRLANRLVGNRDHAAALEITIKGPELQFETPAVIAITGADLSPLVDGKPVQNWVTLHVQRESTLTFGRRRTGARAYVAIAGGFDTPKVLGSRSTHIRSRTGGIDGRALMKGDKLKGGRPATGRGKLVGKEVPDSLRPAYSPNPTLRAVLGPQADHFVPEAVDTFMSSRFTVSPHSDRMGYRLTGPRLVHAASPDIISDATPFGAVQVPANQQPILLMADRQTTGGYPKLAVVISADLPLAAQLMPGNTVTFTLVEVSEAQAVSRELRQRIDAGLPPARN